MAEKPCPCGQNTPYTDCCALYHQGQTWPETAEKLMRSRYAAYVKKAIDYLVLTHHPKQREQNEKAKIQAWADAVSWNGLDVLDVRQGGPKDKQGKVEFKAYFTQQGGQQQYMHERSRFRRYQGKWHYWDGENLGG